MECKNCGIPISKDERAIFKRLIDRGAPDSECLCKKCLAGRLQVPTEAIDKKIAHFKSVGCKLFL